jgi:hypothetical protein
MSARRRLSSMFSADGILKRRRKRVQHMGKVHCGGLLLLISGYHWNDDSLGKHLPGVSLYTFSTFSTV